MATSQDLGGLRDRRLNAGLIHCLNVDLIDISDQAPLEPIGIRREWDKSN